VCICCHIRKGNTTVLSVKLLFPLSQPIGVIRIRQANSFEKKTSLPLISLPMLRASCHSCAMLVCNEHMILLRVVVAAVAAGRLSCRSKTPPSLGGRYTLAMLLLLAI